MQPRPPFLILQAYAVTAVVFGFLAVALGAFGAHALKDVLSSYSQQIYGTAVQYQMFHSLALWLAAMPPVQLHSDWQRWACRCFAAGMLIFSGSLYLLALTGIKAFGMVTPVGGIALLAGWVFLALALVRRHRL